MWRLAVGAALLGLVACCSQKEPEATAPVPVQEVAPPVEPPPNVAASPPSYHRPHKAHHHHYRKHPVKHHRKVIPNG